MPFHLTICLRDLSAPALLCYVSHMCVVYVYHLCYGMNVAWNTTYGNGCLVYQSKDTLLLSMEVRYISRIPQLLTMLQGTLLHMLVCLTCASISLGYKLRSGITKSEDLDILYFNICR